VNWVMDHGRFSILAPAKINWTLRVVGKRLDGFHELESLVSPVSLYDELIFDHFHHQNSAAEGCTPDVEGSGSFEFELQCDEPGIPTDETNLVCRAVRAMVTAVGQSAGINMRIRCRLIKRIPAGGGLGGGSSNAAATLMALNRLWELGWPKSRLSELAATLGSDVSLFLDGGPVVMSGRGEKVTPTKLGWHGMNGVNGVDRAIVLLLPGLHVSTSAVYRAWRPLADPADSGNMNNTKSESISSVEPRPTAQAAQWMEQTFNMLETPAIEVCPQLGDLQRRAAEIAGRPVRISGSGSTMFTAFDTLEEAQSYGQRIRESLAIRTEVVQPIG